MTRPIIILFYFTMAVLSGAVGDGLNNVGIQTWGHVLEGLEIALIFWGVYLLDEDKVLKWYEVLVMFITYICLRFAFFDYAYNLAAENELTYLSDRNFWGQLWLNVLKAPPHGIVWARLVFLVVGVSLPMRYLRD